MSRFLKQITWIALLLTVLGATAGSVVLAIIYRELPSIEAVRDSRLKEPLRIYTIDGRLIAEFGNKKRITTTMEEVPQTLDTSLEFSSNVHPPPRYIASVHFSTETLQHLMAQDTSSTLDLAFDPNGHQGELHVGADQKFIFARTRSMKGTMRLRPGVSVFV